MLARRARRHSANREMRSWRMVVGWLLLTTVLVGVGSSPAGAGIEDVTVTKQADREFGVVDRTLTFDITVTNRGDEDLEGVFVGDLLFFIPEGGDRGIRIGGYFRDAGEGVSCDDIGFDEEVGANFVDCQADIPAGESVKLSVRVTPPSPGTIINFGGGGEAVTIPPLEIPVFSGEPHLEVFKDGPKFVRAGETATYAVTVKNAGFIPLTGVVLRDLPSRRINGMGPLNAINPDAFTQLLGEPACTAADPAIDNEVFGIRGPGEPLDCAIGDLAVNEERTFSFAVDTSRDSGFEPDRYLILNHVGVISNERAKAEAGAATRVIGSNPSLSIEKTGPPSVDLDGEATYTITVSNTGNARLTNVVMRDITAGLREREDLAVPVAQIVDRLAALISTTADISCNPIGVPTTVDLTGFPYDGRLFECRIGDLGIGESVEFKVQVDVPTEEKALPGDVPSVLVGFTNQADAESTETGRIDRVEVTTNVNRPPPPEPPSTAGLTVSKSGPGKADPHAMIEYRITVSNPSPTPSAPYALRDIVFLGEVDDSSLSPANAIRRVELLRDGARVDITRSCEVDRLFLSNPAIRVDCPDRPPIGAQQSEVYIVTVYAGALTALPLQEGDLRSLSAIANQALVDHQGEVIQGNSVGTEFQEGGLLVTKQVDDEFIALNSATTFTIVVKNVSPRKLFEVSLRDIVGPSDAFLVLGVTPQPDDLTTDGCGHAIEAGNIVVRCNFDEMLAGEERRISLTVVGTQEGRYFDQAVATALMEQPGWSPEVALSVGGKADLVVSKGVLGGQSVIRVKNDGVVPAQGLSATDIITFLPDDLGATVELGRITTAQFIGPAGAASRPARGICVVSGDPFRTEVSCNSSESLPPGHVWYIRVETRPNVPGRLSDSAVASTTTPEVTLENNRASGSAQFLDLELRHGYEVFEFTNDNALTVGDRIKYSATVTNTSSLTATGVAVEFVLPSAVEYRPEATSGLLDCRLRSGLDDTVTCTGLTVAASSSATVEIVVEIVVPLSQPPAPARPLTSSAQVEAADQPDVDSRPGNDVPDEDDQDSLTIPFIYDPPFGEKSFDDEGNEVLRWTMVWFNPTPVDAPNSVVRDPIDPSIFVDGPECTAFGGSSTTACFYDGEAVVWNGEITRLGQDGDLMTNRVEISYRIRVPDGATSYTNEASLEVPDYPGGTTYSNSTATTWTRPDAPPPLPPASCAGELTIGVDARLAGIDDPTRGWYATVTKPIDPLGRGTYAVSVLTSDEHDGRIDQTQPAEIVSVEFLNAAGVVVGRTSNSLDLADDTNAATRCSEVGPVELRDAASSMRIVHAGQGSPGPNSVTVETVAVTLLEAAPPPAICTGDHVVTPGVRVMSNTDQAGWQTSVTVPVATIGAGTIRVVTEARDAYDGRAASTQPDERYLIEFLDAGGAVVGTTAATGDLADGVDAVSAVFDLGAVTLSADAVALRINHAVQGPGNPNSVEVGCVAIRRRRPVRAGRDLDP